jgi:nucleoside-diphosphate-sugar epimerase
VRSTSNTAGLPEEVEFKEGDLFDIASLIEATKGQDAVIHLAAYFDFYPSDKELLYSVNVGGTTNLLNAGVENEISLFIYCSTTETIGPVRFPPGDEDTELCPQFDYSKSKVQAEEIIRQISKENKLDHIILRPTGIMGEGDLYTAYEVIEAVNDGAIPVLPGNCEKRLMYIHVDDVVNAFIAALTAKSALNCTILLAPDEPMTYDDLFIFLGDVLGVNPPKRKVPVSLAKIGIGLLSPLKNRGRTTFLWHMQTIQSIDEDRWYKNDRAKRLLGWKPEVTMQEGLKRAINWYYENGYLEKRGD